MNVRDTKGEVYTEIFKKEESKAVADIFFYLHFIGKTGLLIYLKGNTKLRMMKEPNICTVKRCQGCDKKEKTWY